jgi:proline iminopeptidase
MADDVALLCDRLGIMAPILFGHSAGGFVALHLALRHPGSVGALILCDTAPTLAPLSDENPPPTLAERASSEAVLVAQRLFDGDFSPESLEAFGRSVAPYYAGPRHTDIPGRLLRLSTFAPDVAGYFFGALVAEYDLRPRLAEIGAPTLVIVGCYDWVCPPAASRALASQIPGAELVEIADAGHFAFSEEPEGFRNAVTAFLSTSSRRSATAPT